VPVREDVVAGPVRFLAVRIRQIAVGEQICWAFGSFHDQGAPTRPALPAVSAPSTTAG
jgi:hypothetical protein